eukprot:CAMPEP_0197665046 /NCGR_PEP_ID=MMETSP1338-20131121/59002_1 /TAXON_ID=43686 ORGANISM="Pelagodinium beii, Strain RCC1491" /NCGR_SAMPLE_ID=MMETSP1338 /ASSEMBLY_ACC=CAM_ASM_000754 /LENGTH=154 /DNA_ID=CAMNT_0043243799 /DNA_START=69 /DNA_END=533 /DNA_ORIENTATION=+
MPLLPISHNAAAAAAVGLSGTVVGSLAFVSFVDTKLLVKLSSKPGVLSEVFPVWWPYGRDWMVPLLTSTALSNALVYYLTKDAWWLVSVASAMSIASYTVAFMKEATIDPLMKGGTADEVSNFTQEFCRRHHPRLLFAIAGLVNGLSLLKLREV